MLPTRRCRVRVARGAACGSVLPDASRDFIDNIQQEVWTEITAQIVAAVASLELTDRKLICHVGADHSHPEALAQEKCPSDTAMIVSWMGRARALHRAALFGAVAFSQSAERV